MTLTMLINLLKNKWVRYFVLIIALFGGLYVGLNKLHDDVYAQGYNAGIAKQEQILQQNQIKAKQQFDILQAKADSERSKLNEKIHSLTKQRNDLLTQLDKKSNNITQERIDYAKTSSGAMSCFSPNDDGLRIINNSFPASTD